jgi:hypothetical protein
MLEVRVVGGGGFRKGGKGDFFTQFFVGVEWEGG